MSVLEICKAVLFLGIWPVFLGMFPGTIVSRKINASAPVKLLLMYLSGIFIMFAVFEITSVPFILTMSSTTLVTIVYTCIISVLTLASVISACFACRRDGSFVQGRFFCTGTVLLYRDGSSVIPAAVLWLLVIVGTLFVAFFMAGHEHLDGDDSYYIAQSLMADEYDSMFTRDAYREDLLGGVDTRHAIAAWPVMITYFARLTGVHTTIMSHTVMPAFLFMLSMGICGFLATVLFRKKPVYAPVFMLILLLWKLFGNVSLYTAETFEFTRTWQGKSCFANILVPMVITVMLLYAGKMLGGRAEWIMLTVLSVSGVLFTTAAVYLLPILYGTFAFILMITKKSIKSGICTLLSVIPALIFGAIYFVIR